MSNFDFNPEDFDPQAYFGNPDFPNELPSISISEGVNECLAEYGLTLDDIANSRMGLEEVNEGLTADERYELRGNVFVEFGDAINYLYDSGILGMSRVVWSGSYWQVAIRRTSP